MADRIFDKQAALSTTLRVLEYAAGREWWSGSMLARHLWEYPRYNGGTGRAGTPGINTAGKAQDGTGGLVASRLVKRGWLERRRSGHAVEYRITTLGCYRLAMGDDWNDDA